MYTHIDLSGTCYADLDTEVRFSVADSRASGIELIELSLSAVATEQDGKRIANCLTRVLRSMAKESLIEFFIPVDSLHSGSTEGEFLLNKYSAYLATPTLECISYYVKI